MNERIFDMARQSGATDEQGGRSQEVFCFTKSELSAFTELIVKECADIGDLYEGGEYQVRTQILAHFGVK